MGAGVKCSGVTKSFRSEGRTIQAIEGLDLTVGDAELVCLVGPTGCGKTTALKMIGGLLVPDAGEITIGHTSERSASKAPTSQGPVSESRISVIEAPRSALVFQEHGLYPWMSVVENVAFGLEAAGVSRAERLARAARLVEAMGLREFAEALPHQLSVGMRQRVGVARGLAIEPDLLLMDEPFGSLDAQTRRVLQHELESIWRNRQLTILFVTHDIEEAVRLGDRVLVMSDRPGRIVEEVPVPVDRPRGGTAGGRAVMAELEDRIWRLLERPASRALGMEPAG